MANHLMWFQGNSAGFYPNCDGGPEFQCPKSKRIAAEYMRDFFTLTNVVAPYFDPDNYGNMGWAYEKLKDIKEGDTLWLVLVPPKHKVIDVAIESAEAKLEDADIGTLGGLSVDLVGAKFDQGDGGVCEPVGDVTTHTSVTFPDGEDAEPVFQAADVNILNNTKEWYGVGIKVNALPTTVDSLADITGFIAVIAHVYSYDYQLHMQESGMLDGKNKVTGLKAKSMMNTGAGKDPRKIKVKRSGVTLPRSGAKPQGLKARSGKIS